MCIFPQASTSVLSFLISICSYVCVFHRTAGCKLSCRLHMKAEDSSYTGWGRWGKSRGKTDQEKQESICFHANPSRGELRPATLGKTAAKHTEQIYWMFWKTIKAQGVITDNHKANLPTFKEVLHNIILLVWNRTQTYYSIIVPNPITFSVSSLQMWLLEFLREARKTILMFKNCNAFIREGNTEFICSLSMLLANLFYYWLLFRPKRLLLKWKKKINQSKTLCHGWGHRLGPHTHASPSTTYTDTNGTCLYTIPLSSQTLNYQWKSSVTPMSLLLLFQVLGTRSSL